MRDPEVVEQTQNGPHLGGGRAALGRRHRVPVRVAEAAKVGDDDPQVVREHRHDPAEVGPVARPSVQQDDGRAVAHDIVGQPESVDRCGQLAHGRTLRWIDLGAR